VFAGSYEHGPAAGASARGDVRGPIAHQKARGKREIELACGAVKKPWPRLSAVALHTQRGHDGIGMVTAHVDGVDVRAALPQQLTKVLVKAPQLGLGDEPARNSGLIRHDDQCKPGLAQADERVRRVREKLELLGTRDKIDVSDDDAIAIQESRGPLPGRYRLNTRSM